MAMAIPTAVVSIPFAHEVNLDTVTTILLVVLAAGVGWFLWRRR